MCIELEFGECDQDDREDDLQCERDGVLLEEVDMVVMVITEADMVTQFHKMELSAEAMELDSTEEPKAEEPKATLKAEEVRASPPTAG